MPDVLDRHEKVARIRGREKEAEVLAIMPGRLILGVSREDAEPLLSAARRAWRRVDNGGVKDGILPAPLP
jgi:hypothetical protein